MQFCSFQQRDIWWNWKKEPYKSEPCSRALLLFLLSELIRNDLRLHWRQFKCNTKIFKNGSYKRVKTKEGDCIKGTIKKRIIQHSYKVLQDKSIDNSLDIKVKWELKMNTIISNENWEWSFRKGHKITNCPIWSLEWKVKMRGTKNKTEQKKKTTNNQQNTKWNKIMIWFRWFRLLLRSISQKIVVFYSNRTLLVRVRPLIAKKITTISKLRPQSSRSNTMEGEY